MKITTPSNSLYVKASKRESEFWSGDAAYEYMTTPARVKEYENLKRTGDKHMDELTYLKTLGHFAQ